MPHWPTSICGADRCLTGGVWLTYHASFPCGLYIVGLTELELQEKVKERGVAWLIDRVVASTLRLVAELAIIRGSVESHESVFKSFEGHDINKLSADLQNLNTLVSNLRAQVSARDTQIGILRASRTALEAKLVE